MGPTRITWTYHWYKDQWEPRAGTSVLPPAGRPIRATKDPARVTCKRCKAILARKEAV